ncbi:MAG: hypothetical protein MJA29_08080, partial [Candidatus Omnitrophica bacterium]|nr:hypothetical protein [Candidatus Omnitrophota bacterium]
PMLFKGDDSRTMLIGHQSRMCDSMDLTVGEAANTMGLKPADLGLSMIHSDLGPFQKSRSDDSSLKEK